MSDAIELATAYVQVVTSLKGSQGQLAEELVGEAGAAGDKAGQETGSRFSKAMGKAPWGKMSAAAGAAVVGGFGVLYNVGSTFDDLSDTIRVGTGASGDALTGLVDIAENVGRNVPASFSAIGPVVSDLNTRLGLSGGTLETVASQYLEAGRILGEDVDIDKTSAAFSAFGVTGDDVSGAMDTLFRVSQNTGVGMNDLATTVQTNGAALGQLGFSFEESAALAGVLDKAGLNAGRTMGSMGKALVSLAKDGEEPQAAFQRVSGEIGTLIAKGDEAGALNLASKLFGVKGAPQMVQALRDGTLSAESLGAAMAGSGDTILGVGDDTADFAESWQLVKNNAQLALAPLASSVFTALGDSLTAVMPYLQSFGSWLGENQWVLAAVAAVIGVTLVAAFVAWTASVWAATIALLANPITWIIIGIVALIAALVLLAMNWDQIAAWISSTWGAFVGWLSGTWTSIVGAVTGFGGRIASFLSGLWSGIVSTATTWWNALVTFVAGIPGRIMAALARLGQLGAEAAAWFMGVLTAATDKFGQVVTFVGGIPGKILSALGNVAGLLVRSGSSLVNGFLSGIQSGWGRLTGWVSDGMAKLRGLWPFSPAKWGPFSGRGYVTYSGEALTEDFAASITAGTDKVHKAAWGMMDAAATTSPTMTHAEPAPDSGKGLTVYVNNPVPEKASESIARVYARSAYLGLDAVLVNA